MVPVCDVVGEEEVIWVLWEESVQGCFCGWTRGTALRLEELDYGEGFVVTAHGCEGVLVVAFARREYCQGRGGFMREENSQSIHFFEPQSLCCEGCITRVIDMD